MANLSRRLLLQAIPFIGTAAALPAVAAPSSVATAQERFEHHLSEAIAALAEIAGPCDGFSLTAGVAPMTGDQWHRARRGWILREHIRGTQYMDVERGGDFDTRTGEAIYDPVPDLSTWVPRRGGSHA